MNRWAWALCAVASLDALAASGATDSVAQVLLRHMAQGVRDARPGDWISYRTDAGGGRVSFWRFSVVGAEKDVRGRDSLWIEIELGDHSDLRAPLAQIRMLVARETGLTAEAVTRVLVALGADQPQEISPEQLGRILQPEGAPARVRPEPIASETIRPGRESRLMTHAGTLSAVPIEIYRGGTLVERVWMSYRLPLLHLAKLELPGIGHVMEVRDFGFDARPRMALPAAEQAKVRLEPNYSSPAVAP